jgi:signal transduction histidine kinase
LDSRSAERTSARILLRNAGAAAQFRPTQIETLELIARIAAIAIEHARRHDEERRRSSRFELIARIAADIHREPDCDALLQRAADAIHGILKFPNVDIPLLDPSTRTTLVVASRRQLQAQRSRRSTSCRFPGASWVRRARRAHPARQRRAHTTRATCAARSHAARAELAVPICLGERVLGVVNVEGDRPFDELDRRSLEVIADYLAVAIDNSQLSGKASEAAVLAERQRLARELHDNVTQILSSMSLLSQTLGAAWQRSPAKARRVCQAAATRADGFAECACCCASSRRRTRAATHRSRARDDVSSGWRTCARSAARRADETSGGDDPDGLAVKTGFSGYVPQQLENEEALYRVCQEAVSNTVRHAGANACASKRRSTEPKPYCASPTMAAAWQRIPARRRLGSMRSRVESLHGHFRISPANPRAR